jgi:TusA-related sulfurtransferase
MPIVRISQAIAGLKPGETLQVEATDPAFRSDVEAWSRKTGNSIVEFEEGEVLRVTLRRN